MKCYVGIIFIFCSFFCTVFSGQQTVDFQNGNCDNVTETDIIDKQNIHGRGQPAEGMINATYTFQSESVITCIIVEDVNKYGISAKEINITDGGVDRKYVTILLTSNESKFDNTITIYGKTDPDKTGVLKVGKCDEKHATVDNVIFTNETYLMRHHDKKMNATITFNSTDAEIICVLAVPSEGTDGSVAEVKEFGSGNSSVVLYLESATGKDLNYNITVFSKAGMQNPSLLIMAAGLIVLSLKMII